MNNLKKLLFLLLFFSSINASQDDIRQRAEQALNLQLEENNELGKFHYKEGKLVFSGSVPPQWAVNEALVKLGIDPAYGTAGLNPFYLYTYHEWKDTDHYKYMINELKCIDLWVRDPQRKSTGLEIISRDFKRDGKNVYKNYVDFYQKRAERRAALKNFTQNVIPELTKTFSNSKVLLLGMALVFTVFGIPTIIWHGSQKFFAWVFVKRPTILGEKDSDIYGSFFHRLFWKFPDVAKVAVNPDLQKQLRELITTNKLITAKNKGNFFNHPVKTPYHHILAYGPPGTGKTLFAKNLAKESDMHFMYLTVSDLSQLIEEEAIQELNSYFKYARKYGPTILIVDEADRLFAGGDIKAKKLALLFQREFSKSVDSNVQLFFITNYPNTFPLPILNRVSKFLKFDNPTYKTQLRLMSYHLSRALKLQNKPGNLLKASLKQLSKSEMQGLVGRDIESIAISVALSLKPSIQELKKEIAEFKSFREIMKNFQLEENKKKEEPKKGWLA